MRVVITEPRVENIPFLYSEFSKFGIVILEEPRNDLFYDVLNGKLEADVYAAKLNFQFPIFTKKLMEMLRELKGRQILQIEPYLEEVERIRNFKEGDEKVREMERKINSLHHEYSRALLKGKFDDIVEKFLNLSMAEAERIILRDEMRAEAVMEYDDAVVQATPNHFKLLEILDAEAVRVSKLIAEKLGVEFVLNPGEKLMRAIILGEENDLHLLAARSLIFSSLLERREMLPEFDGDYPHFLHEQKLSRFVERLDYEKCRNLFHKLWSYK